MGGMFRVYMAAVDGHGHMDLALWDDDEAFEKLVWNRRMDECRGAL